MISLQGSKDDLTSKKEIKNFLKAVTRSSENYLKRAGKQEP